MQDGLHETLGLLGHVLPELEPDKALFDQQEALIQKGICVFDLVHFLSGLEDAFFEGGIAMTEAIIELHRTNCDMYEHITVAMVRSTWDGILKFYGFVPSP